MNLRAIGCNFRTAGVGLREKLAFTPEARAMHAEGWAKFLPRLAAVVVGADAGPDPARDGVPRAR